MQTKAAHFLFAFLLLLSSIGLSIVAAPTANTGRVARSTAKNSVTPKETRSISQSNSSTETSEPYWTTTTYNSLGKRERVLETPYNFPGYEHIPGILKAYEDLPKSVCSKDEAKDPCKFPSINEGSMLRLERSDSKTVSFGIRGKELGYGTYGRVFKIGVWDGGAGSEYPNGELVAKWFARVSEGLKEIENLSIMGELVDWGFLPKSKGTSESTSLWAIMLKKKGDPIDHLQEFVDYVQKGSREVCEQYMAQIREDVVTANEWYITNRPGSPYHNDIHKSNVLFEFKEYIDTRTGKHVLHRRANLVDFGRIRFGQSKFKVLNREVPEDSEEGNNIVNDVRKQLEEGYVWVKPSRDHFDFSNDNNCNNRPTNGGKANTA